MDQRSLRNALMAALLVPLSFSVKGATAQNGSDKHPTYAPDSRECPLRSAPMLLGAHRGGRHLWPENTLVAFSAAACQWPEILLECDVTASRDGHAVVIHDNTVDRTTNGKGFIDRMTLAELKALDAAYHFSPDGGITHPYRGKGVTLPSLAEVLQAIPRHRVLIEMKESPGIARATAAAIAAAGAEQRCIVAAIRPSLLQEFKELQPQTATCYDYLDAAAMMRALREGGWETYTPTHLMLAMSPSLKRQFNLTPAELAAIRAKGILLSFFTINSAEEMRQLLELGVDSILSDKPNLLERVIREHRELRR